MRTVTQLLLSVNFDEFDGGRGGETRRAEPTENGDVAAFSNNLRFGGHLIVSRTITSRCSHQFLALNCCQQLSRQQTDDGAATNDEGKQTAALEDEDRPDCEVSKKLLPQTKPAY